MDFNPKYALKKGNTMVANTARRPNNGNIWFTYLLLWMAVTTAINFMKNAGNGVQSLGRKVRNVKIDIKRFRPIL